MLNNLGLGKTTRMVNPSFFAPQFTQLLQWRGYKGQINTSQYPWREETIWKGLGLNPGLLAALTSRPPLLESIKLPYPHHYHYR